MVCLNAAMSACEKGGHWSRALELFDAAAAAAAAAATSPLDRRRSGDDEGNHDDSWRGGSPDLWTFNTAICACERGRRWERALALLRAMRPAGLTPNSVSYCTAICTLVSSDRLDRAFACFERARADGAVEDYGSHWALLEGCKMRGDVARAKTVQAALERDGFRNAAAVARMETWHVLPLPSSDGRSRDSDHIDANGIDDKQHVGHHQNDLNWVLNRFLLRIEIVIVCLVCQQHRRPAVGQV